MEEVCVNGRGLCQWRGTAVLSRPSPCAIGFSWLRPTPSGVCTHRHTPLPGSVGYVLGFNAVLFALYSLVPLLLQSSSATLFNLSLLTSDVYSLLFGLFLFGYHFSWVYLLAFGAVIVGLVVYNLEPTSQARARPLAGRDEAGGDAGVEGDGAGRTSQLTALDGGHESHA